MSKPSEVVRLIEGLGFPDGIPGTMRNGQVLQHGAWNARQVGVAGSILARVDAIDPRILRESLTDRDRDMLSEAVETLRQAHSAWLHGDRGQALTTHHVTTIYGLLKKAKDEATPVAAADLPFITDPKLKEDIARDLTALPRLISDEQWKAATVIGGSVVEAILLAKVEELHATAVALAKSRGWKSPSGQVLQPEAWGLERLIQAARSLQIITDDVAKACSLAQYYRNSIHPGVARVRHPASAGTAYSTMGAVHTLIAKWK